MTSLIFALSACSTDTVSPDTQPVSELTPNEAPSGDFDTRIHDSAAMQAGTTIFGLNYPQDHQRIVEVDASGSIVWEYVLPDEVLAGQGGNVPSLTDVAVLEHDRLLFAVYGKGVFEIDREGQVLWSFLDAQASHDVDRLDNGNTLVTRTWAEKGQEQLVEVNRLGEVVWTWTGAGAFDAPMYAEVSDEGGAWMHINSVERRSDGSTAMCVRNFNAVTEIDEQGLMVRQTAMRSSGSDLHRTTGAFRGRRPHACEWQDQDTVLFATRSPERLIEVDVTTQSIEWEWSHPQVTTIRDADRLGNGNTLVVTGDRLLEVSAAGDIVWELTPPVHPDGIAEAHLLHAASRIGLDGQVHDID